MTSPKRNHRFVVGYPHHVNCVYGKDSSLGESRLIDPMTWREARVALHDMPQPHARIYELVPVPVKETK